jgi:aryl-alcohol dehydrogenase
MSTTITAAVARTHKASFEIGVSLIRGWTFKTIIQGSSVPQRFIPRLISLWQQGRFPVEKLTRQYSLPDINKAFDDSASGAVVKPVIVF